MNVSCILHLLFFFCSSGDLGLFAPLFRLLPSMLLVRVDDRVDGSVQVILRMTEDEEGQSLEALRAQASEGSGKFWARSLVADDPIVAVRLQEAQRAGKEYHAVVLGPEEDVPEAVIAEKEDGKEQKYFESYDSIEVETVLNNGVQ